MAGDEMPAPIVEEKRATNSGTLDEQIESPAFFQDCNLFLKDVVPEVGHDFDTGQITLVHGAVERLAGKGFLVDRAIFVAIKETSDFVFQFEDSLRGIFNQNPGKLLIVEVGSAPYRILEMPFQRIGRVEDCV